MTNSERDDLIVQWRHTKVHLDNYKIKEMELRKEIVAGCFSEDQVEGTENIELGNDWKLKAVKKMNYRCVGKQEKIIATLAKLPSELSKRLVSWKPSLSTREFKLLENGQAKIVSEIVEIRPGTPTLELIAPKE